jgi:hypothetical protein
MEMDTTTTSLRKAYYSSLASSQQVTREYKMSEHAVSTLAPARSAGVRSSNYTRGSTTIERQENKKSVET